MAEEEWWVPEARFLGIKTFQQISPPNFRAYHRLNVARLFLRASNLPESRFQDVLDVITRAMDEHEIALRMAARLAGKAALPS